MPVNPDISSLLDQNVLLIQQNKLLLEMLRAIDSEIKTIKKQVDSFEHNLGTKAINNMVDELHKHFIKPKDVVLTSKQKRKIAVNNALAKL